MSLYNLLDSDDWYLITHYEPEPLDWRDLIGGLMMFASFFLLAILAMCL